MDHFKIIYRILKYLEKAMAVEEPDFLPIMAKGLKIPECQWLRLMKMLLDEGYIKGVLIQRDLSGSWMLSEPFTPEITLKGLEHLQENSFMKKAADLAKGIAEIL